jgi:hypothetical protein
MKPSGRFVQGDLGRGAQAEGRGVREVDQGKAVNLLLKHPTAGKGVWVTVRTKKDAA